jgi:hypothetical protein
MGFVCREQVRVDEFESAYAGPTHIPGQKQKSSRPVPTSGLPLKADIRRSGWVVRKVPQSDLRATANVDAIR